jgi:hypothetical protein
MNTHSSPNNLPEPGQDLMNLVKGGFILKGKTMSGWCRENSICRTNAQWAVLGKRNGPKAQALRERLIKASNAIKLLS